MLNALKDRGCRIIHASTPDRAPFVFTFELSSGERMGVVAYAFLATRTPTKNRPKDERSFQVKYGSKESYAAENLHRVRRDPLGLFTTLFIGISPSEGYFVSADPAMHDPTKFFIRIEFKDEHVEEIAKEKWFAWERDRRLLDEPIEVMVGATESSLRALGRGETPKASGPIQGRHVAPLAGLALDLWRLYPRSAVVRRNEGVRRGAKGFRGRSAQAIGAPQRGVREMIEADLSKGVSIRDPREGEPFRCNPIRRRGFRPG